MTVLRRLDALLEPATQPLLDTKSRIDGARIGRAISAETHAIGKADLLLKAEVDAATTSPAAPSTPRSPGTPCPGATRRWATSRRGNTGRH